MNPAKLMSYIHAAAAGISFISLINAETTANTIMSLLNLLFMWLNIYYAKKNNDIYEKKLREETVIFTYEHKDEMEKIIKEKREQLSGGID